MYSATVQVFILGSITDLSAVQNMVSYLYLKASQALHTAFRDELVATCAEHEGAITGEHRPARGDRF